MNTPRAFKRGISTGLLIILAIMPFHAFLSVWFGHIFGHQADFQSWKEVVLLILGAMAAVWLAQDPTARDRLRRQPIYAVLAVVALAILVTLFTRPSFTAIIFGAKTDLEFLLAFVLAVLVADPVAIRFAVRIILATSAVVFIFNMFQIFVLPRSFLRQFGYGWAPGQLMPFQKLSSTSKILRFASTLGGPNQLGTFALLPMALAAILAIRKRQWWLLAIDLLGAISLWHTYSRGAWLGAIAALICLAVAATPGRFRTGLISILAGVAILGGVAVAELAHISKKFSAYIFHSGTTSDQLHAQSINVGLSSSIARPFGHGLGTAGPAVFHSGAGQIIENYYLQITYEYGLLGLAAFAALIVSLGHELLRSWRQNPLAPAAFMALVGISVTSLFLPAWTDSSTALIFWIAAGLAIGMPRQARHV